MKFAKKANNDYTLLYEAPKGKKHGHNQGNCNEYYNNNKKWWVWSSWGVYDNEGGFPWQKGDVLKIGKIIFKIKEIEPDIVNTFLRTHLESSTNTMSSNLNQSIIKYKDKDNINSNNNNNNCKSNIIHNTNSDSLCNSGLIRNSNSNSNNNINNRSTNKMNILNINIMNNYNNTQGSTPTVTENPMNKIHCCSLNTLPSTKAIIYNDDTQTLTQSPGNFCRICLCEAINKENPWICPCNCIGSVKYIHLLCLRQWFKSKMEWKVLKHITIYSYSSWYCEICKTAIPESICFNNIYYSMIDFELESKHNYIWLENITNIYKVSTANKKHIYWILFNDKEDLSIGRWNVADIQINEISISRLHCVFHLKENTGIYIKDNKSKYGTLRLIQNNVDIKHKISLGVQWNQFYIHIKIIVPCWYLFLSCLKGKYNVTKKYLRKYITSIIKEELWSHKKEIGEIKEITDNTNQNTNINNNVTDNTFDYGSNILESNQNKGSILKKANIDNTQTVNNITTFSYNLNNLSSSVLIKNTPVLGRLNNQNVKRNNKTNKLNSSWDCERSKIKFDVARNCERKLIGKLNTNGIDNAVRLNSCSVDKYCNGSSKNGFDYKEDGKMIKVINSIVFLDKH